MDSICKRPFTAVARWRWCLGVNRKRIQRLMRIMGLEAIYPKRPLRVRPPDTRFTRICCGIWRSRGPIRCGPATSPTFRCVMASCTWRR